jgi:hypothetical protein
MRRLAVVLAIIAIALATGLPAAAGPSIDTNPRDWEMPSGQCPNLAPGTSLTGSGIEKSITTVRTDARGITTIINATHTHGTSFDQDGNEYVFDYSNEFRGSDSVANPGLFAGLMTDHFSNSGSGPATLNNGFVANITFTLDFSTFIPEPISSHGDPLNFADGSAMCDPL